MLAADHDNEYMMIDSTIVRAHQHSAGARKKRGPAKPSADPGVALRLIVRRRNMCFQLFKIALYLRRCT
jgi:hypothetical protein